MDESEDNMSADDSKSGDTLSSVTSKPKKRSIVERELETNLTARVTSPVTNGEAGNTSRYGRARRAKGDFEISESENNAVDSLKSPAPELTPSSAQLPPVYKMYASNSPVKSKMATKPERRSKSIETSLDNQIENIYNENILLSRFSSNEKKKQSPNTKFPKVYVRTDLIQKKEKEKSVTLINSTFLPGSGKKSGNSHLNNILERSSEKYNLNSSTTKTRPQNGLTKMSSVVKTLDFDSNKKKKENHNKTLLTKSEIFELEAKCEYQVGDLAWARMGTYPFWPCIITREPTTNMFVKIKVFGRVQHHVIHVTFFGDNGRRSWIVDSMLRKFLGQLEFETAREHFSPKTKKRDPKLYAAFFVSEKKMSQWSISVEEAETLLREPKRLRIDIFNDMLVKSQSVKAEKQNKGSKVVRTSSNVSLSESLFDTLFSEKDGITEDLDGSRSKTRNSLDVSEVVTACLDNMAAKTGNSKIQRQSHMDRWLQKAKSKTPEKLQVKLQVPTKEKEKVISTKKKRWEAPKNVPIKKPYSFRNSLESQTLKSHHNEHDYSNKDNTIDEVDTTVNCVMSGRGIGRIAKVESLANKENKKYDIFVEITDSEDQDVTCKSPTFTQDCNEIDDASFIQHANTVKSNEDSEIPKSSEKIEDVTCESPTFTQDYNEFDDASSIQDVNIVKSNEDWEIPKSNEMNGIELGKRENEGIDVVLNNKQDETEAECEQFNLVNDVVAIKSLDDDKMSKATEICMEVEFEKTQHKTPNKVCYSGMNGHLEKSVDMPFQSLTDIMNKKSRSNKKNIDKNVNVSISSKNNSRIDINKSSDSVTIQDTDTSFDNSSQEEIDNSFSSFIKPRSLKRPSRKKRSLRTKTAQKPHTAKNRDDGFSKYAKLRQDALIDEHPELTHNEIMAYLLKTWQYENRDESDTDNKSNDVILDRIEKNTESENILNTTKRSDNDNMSNAIDMSQDCNQSKDKPLENTISLEVKSQDMDVIKVSNQSKDKQINNTLKNTMSSEAKSKNIDIMPVCSQSIDKQVNNTLKSTITLKIKSQEIDVIQVSNQSEDKPIDNTLKSTKLLEVKMKDIDAIQDRNQSTDKSIESTLKSTRSSDVKRKDMDFIQDRNQYKDKLVENTLKSKKSSHVKGKDIDVIQDRNQSIYKPIKNTLRSMRSSDVNSKNMDVIQDRNHSEDKPIESTLVSTRSSDVKIKDIDAIQDHNQFIDKPIESSLKSTRSDVKSKDMDVMQNRNQYKDKLVENTLRSMRSSDVKSKNMDVTHDRNLSKGKPLDDTFKSPKSSDIKSKDIDFSQNCNQSKDKLIENTLKIIKSSKVPIDDTFKSPKLSDIKSKVIEIVQDSNQYKDKLVENTLLNNKSSHVKSKDIDVVQDRNLSKDKPIDDTLKSTKSSHIKSQDIDISQDHKITKEKVNAKRITMDNIKGQPKKKICTVNLTDFLLDSSINILTFDNADESFVKAVYEKANKSKKLDKKMNHKNIIVKVNDVLALKTESSTCKMNGTDTSCDQLGSDQLNNSSNCVLRKETQNGYRHSNRKRYSTTAIQINEEKARNLKNSELTNTSVSEKDQNCINVVTHEKVIDKIDNFQDIAVVEKPKNDILEIDSMLSSEINNDSILIKHCSDKISIQDEILCDVFVANKENVNIENKHTEKSSASSSEPIIDFPGNMFPDPSDITTADDTTNTGQEIDSILKSIDDIVNDRNPEHEPIFPELDRNKSLEAIKPVENDSNSFNKCVDKEFSQNKEVEFTILTKDDKKTSKSEVASKKQPELNKETVTDQKMLKYHVDEAKDVVWLSQNLPESVTVNGFHSSDDCSPDFSDGEFNAETLSVNSEDSIPLSKVKNKLRLKNRHKKNKDIDYPEFIKYMELRQDALMDDHPELSQEELVDYMHKAWLYEQNSKSDYMKTDDIERSGLVKGLNDDLRQKSIRNSFRESKKRRNKQKDEDSLSIHSDIASRESSPERKVLEKSEQIVAVNSDISDRSLRRWRRIKTLGETKTDAIPETTSSDTQAIPVKEVVSSNAKDIQDEPQLVATKQTQPSNSKDCNIQRYFGIFNHVDTKNKDSTKITPENEVKIEEEVDSEACSIKSDEIEVSLSKRKQRRQEKQATKDDPEFLKYLELRQDALIDENPQLSQDEIISYLFKTWLYEESAKSDIKKSDDIEQASLVKGLNPEAMQPKKIKRKIKTDKEPTTDDDVVPKDKPKRKTSQPYYIEDELSNTEDVEMFDIFKSKQQLQDGEVIDVDTGDEIDEVELYFSELTNPKPNIFKGLVREKVCEICERTSNLVKCKGCSCMFHVNCVTKQLEVKVEFPTPTRGRKKKKKAGRKPKNLDESESQSDEKSQGFSEENNVSIDDLEPESRTVDAEDFESVLEVKMKELIPAIEIYDSCSSDDGLDWKDSVAGKCQIVDVLLKPKSEPVDSDFKCNNCQKFDLPVCFVCKSVISKTGVEYRQRCQAAHCNTYYHMECLDHWPQTQFNAGQLSKISNNAEERFEDFMCPKHVCHTCVCDDPRGCKTRFSGDKLARCVRCPATYHSFTKCLPAGSQILTGSHIVCPRHYEHRPGKVPCHVNTGWCFICALGGSLICCEYCPTSFHAECLNIKPPEGGYMCEDCETGRLPLYGEMVWVKLGHYRWWPGIVLHPAEIPENIMAVKHSPGEFVVRFFGQYDHYWVNRGRVFPFQEGDSGRVSSQKSKIDAAFTTAMEHAQRACEILKSAENNEEEDTDIASSLLPPHYVKLKVNKPVGSLCGRRIDIEESSLTQCDCNPDEEDPCGPYSQCLNRMLLTECGPSCRAGERCNNRAFEKRRYPRVAPYRTPHRGWGLRALQDVKAGTFVIEYVGELLDEEEFRRRMNRKHEIRDENFYFLTLDKERMIDAGPKGNLARFMNHCCEPNCETQKWTVLGDVRVGLFAINDIPANSELTFNYNLECTGIEKKRCMCGAKRCSGYIGAKPKQDEPQPKKKALVAKRPYKKRNKATEDSPSTNKNKPKRPVGRPAKPKELTDIEKDLFIIKNATNGLSSDSEGSGRLSSLDSDKNIKALKRKRVDFSTDEVASSEANSPSSKKVKLDDEKIKEVGD